MININHLDRFSVYADVPIRFLIGVHLLVGVLDNIVSWERMIEFEKFLEAQQFIFPLASAILSVYAQAICGLLFLIGWKIRIAAIVMIFNFLVALLMVHWGDTYPNSFPAIAMLMGSIFFLLNGSGKLSLDHYLGKRKN